MSLWSTLMEQENRSQYRLYDDFTADRMVWFWVGKNAIDGDGLNLKDNCVTLTIKVIVLKG